MSEWLKAHPSYTERDYLYKLSKAKIDLMAIDYTHSVTLDKKTKEKWDKFCKSMASAKTKGSSRGAMGLNAILEHQKKMREHKSNINNT